MVSLFLRMSAVLIWSILAGVFITSYLDSHNWLDDQKYLDLNVIRERLTHPFAKGEDVFTARKIKDNWVYDVKKRRVLFIESLPFISGADHLQTLLKSPIKKDEYYYILNKIKELQLPDELALIPILESEYNAEAISNKGAGGLWQLMPKTADELGLSDKDRFILEPSTLAALNYLKLLYKKFGKWDLAIAAYNAGSNRVEKALLENPKAKSVHELNLPPETKTYVTRFYIMQIR